MAEMWATNRIQNMQMVSHFPRAASMMMQQGITKSFHFHLHALQLVEVIGESGRIHLMPNVSSFLVY